MSNSTKRKQQIDMDQTDMKYIMDLLAGALRERDWNGVIEAKEYIKEWIDDDGGSIELEE
jgi:hypothetical protein